MGRAPSSITTSVLTSDGPLDSGLSYLAFSYLKEHSKAKLKKSHQVIDVICKQEAEKIRTVPLLGNAHKHFIKV